METTSISAVRLPPSARDFFVYERVVLELASTRQVAEEAKISQTRVRQVVGRVLDWLAETLPAKPTLAGESQLLVARHIAADRLEAFYRDANKKWLATDQCKYANLALRVIAAQTRLPAVAGCYEALMADVLNGPLPDAKPENLAENLVTRVPPGNARPRGSSLADAPTTCQRNQEPSAVSFAPPSRDCSPPAQFNSTPAPQPIPNSSATPDPAAPCDSLSPRDRSARRAFLTPAQSHLSDEEASPNEAITELKLSPDTLGASLQKPLTRQQRRRLHRARSVR
jgi:hypothetical protein